jgi:transcriptional regulator with XRE-family HTH domain
VAIPDAYQRDRPRRNETPTDDTIEVGQRFRRGRQQAGLSQRRVAERSGISQSEISRLERGMTPGMSAYRVFAIAMALGDRFPFGICPHPHRCAYSAEAPSDHGTRPGVIDMTGRTSSDGVGRLKPADLMELADSAFDGWDGN